MAVPKRKSENASHLRENEKKWGATLVDAGWTLIPSTILERQRALGLDPVDLNILLQLARHWWQAGNPPHPSIRTIAECIDRSVSTVQRRLKKLERDEIIKIEHRFDKNRGQTSSNYYFPGLIAAATEYAQEAIEERARTQKEVADRRTRKAPVRPKKHTLKVVSE